jgi:hypothetical protein
MRGRIIVTILAAFLLRGTCAYAQEWPSVVQIVEKVRTDVNLDQEQYDTVKLIIEKHVAKRKQIWAELSHGPTVAQTEELASELYSQLREVLTPYQMKQWKKILLVINQDMDTAAAAKGNDQPLPVNE